VLHIQDGATLVVGGLDDLRDFNQPHMPGMQRHRCHVAIDVLSLAGREAAVVMFLSHYGLN